MQRVFSCYGSRKRQSLATVFRGRGAAYKVLTSPTDPRDPLSMAVSPCVTMGQGKSGCLWLRIFAATRTSQAMVKLVGDLAPEYGTCRSRGPGPIMGPYAAQALVPSVRPTIMSGGTQSPLHRGFTHFSRIHVRVSFTFRRLTKLLCGCVQVQLVASPSIRRWFLPFPDPHTRPVVRKVAACSSIGPFQSRVVLRV